MTQIKSPASFDKMCLAFDQDTFDFVKTDEDFIYIAMSIINKNEYKELSIFLKKILNHKSGNQIIQNLWNRSQAEIRFTDTNFIRFIFEGVLNRIVE